MQEIPLSRGKVAIVDDEDYEYLNQWKWYALKSGTTYYARRALYLPGYQQVVVTMHQILCGKGADHINGSGLDNRRENLRLCTHQQNVFNKKPDRNSSSRYKGVSLRKNGKWLVQIQIDGKKIHLGCFVDEEEAARAYDNAAYQLFGRFARLNYPGESA